MIQFYQYHLQGVIITDRGHRTGEALRQPQGWLRDVTNSRLREPFKQFKQATPDVLNVLNENTPLQVRMVPASDGTLEVKFPLWLPRNEVDEIGRSPLVRKAVFNHLIKMLFDASQSETGVLEINTFLKSARRSKSSRQRSRISLP
jgi:hypothetical protein